MRRITELHAHAQQTADAFDGTAEPQLGDVHEPSAPVNTGTIMLVRVRKTGGSDGSSSGPPTWVYTLYRMDVPLPITAEHDEYILAVNQSPKVGRTDGSFSFAPTGDVAFAYLEGGSWKLWQCNEIPPTIGCRVSSE